MTPYMWNFQIVRKGVCEIKPLGSVSEEAQEAPIQTSRGVFKANPSGEDGGGGLGLCCPSSQTPREVTRHNWTRVWRKAQREVLF